jgi:hypothetical protein
MSTHQALPQSPAHDRYLPAWQVDTLPAPLPYSFRNLLKIIGPGAILLAAAIGSGEWLLGPAAVIKYGPGLLVMVSVSILLQVIINTEAVRYTLYTGEPIFTGFMRTAPGPKLWGPVYFLFAVLHQGWPGWAATSAAALFAGIYGALPEAADAGTVRWLGYFSFAAAVLLLLFGRSVQRTLELVSWFMLAFTFSFLILTNLLVVPSEQWWLTFKGFFGFGEFFLPPDWFLLAALIPYSGNGGVGNLVISNWARDKGFGMGSRVGAIASAVGGTKIKLSSVGKVFPVNEGTLKQWRTWWHYVLTDQCALWAGGCFVGMFLTCNLTAGTTPRGTDLQGLGVGAYQAHYLAQKYGPLLWHLTLLNGFWILFKTQLAVMDSMCRLTTDVLWTASPAVRRLARDSVSKIYYTLLGSFAVWGCIALQLAQPLTLIKLGAVNAGFISAFSASHLLIVNRRLLPEPLRPPRWRQVGLLLCTLFYGFFIMQWLLRL